MRGLSQRSENLEQLIFSTIKSVFRAHSDALCGCCCPPGRGERRGRAKETVLEAAHEGSGV